MTKLFVAGFCLLFGLSVVAGCGGNGSAIQRVPPQVSPTPTSSSAPILSSPSPPPHSPTPSSGITVALTSNPSSLAIDTNQIASLTATVSRDPNKKGVNWTVNCGNLTSGPCGSMAQVSSASGAIDIFTAPTDFFGGGSISAQVTATSVSDPTKLASVNVFVSGAPVPVKPPPSASGNVGEYVFYLLGNWVQGGTPPITWGIKSGTLPSGLTFNASAESMSGIPTAVFASTLVFVFTDSGNPPISLNVSVPITIGPMLPLMISPASGALPGGVIGQVYNQQWWCRPYCSGFNVQGSGGMQGSLQRYTFTWSAAPGSSLVPGLSMTSGGHISGTPTTAGTYNFIVTVTDFESPPKQAAANYTITVRH